MCSLGDTVSVKDHWGHSSNVVAVELAHAAVKRLALSNHDSVLDDRMLKVVLANTVRFESISRRGGKVDVISAYDGLELTICSQAARFCSHSTASRSLGPVRTGNR